MNKNINDKYWMSIVDTVAQASTCRVKIGTVIVHRNTVVGMGYVGSISGDHHCSDSDIGCLLVNNHGVKGSSDSGKSCIRTIHAETNAVLKCTERGSHKNGWLTCYSTYSPCLECFKLLLQIGVRQFIFEKNYKDINRDIYIASLNRSVINNLLMKQYHE